MHIMEIVSGGGTNGAIIHCLQLIRELIQRNHRVTLVCRPNAWIAQQLRNEPIQIVESQLSRWPPGELRLVSQQIRQQQVDVVHTHQSRAHFFGVLLRWLSGCPCVATAHARHFQLHWMFNDFVIANSDATRQFHRRFNLVRGSRIETIHCFIDSRPYDSVPVEVRRRVRDELEFGEDIPLLGVVGDVIPRKGHLFLVRALPRILDSFPDTRLMIIGSRSNSYATRVEQCARELGVQDAVVWTGFRRDVPALMHAMDICVSAAVEESFGMTPAEAMLAGRPVVATAVGGLPESVIHGETGLIVPPKDSAALADAIVELLGNPERRNRMGRAGNQWIRQNFSAANQVRRIERVFEQAVLRKHAA